MDKLRESMLNGSALGLVGMMIAMAASHPEMIKDFLMFGLAWVLLKKGVGVEIKKVAMDLHEGVGKIAAGFTVEIGKITESIERLTSTMASLEQNHSTRLTNLEIKVDNLIQTKKE